MQNDISKHYDLRGEYLLTTKYYLHEERFNDITRANILLISERLLAKWKGGRRDLLDLCCGTGIQSLYPAQLGFQVLGVDLSPKSIEAGQWLARENQLSKVCQFQAGDALEFLKNSTQKFDVIQVYAGIYYFDRAQILALIRDHLRSNGCFLCIETSGSQPIAQLLRWFKSHRNSNRDQGSLHNLTRISDLDVFCKLFPKTQIIYLDFFSMMATPLRRFKRLSRFIFKYGTLLDRILFDQLKCRFLAFRFIIYSEP